MTDSPQLENGYIRIANEIWDALMKNGLPGQEMKVLMCILRHTYGWQVKKKCIPLKKFTQATGIAKSSVCRAIKKLTDKNMIFVDQSVNDLYPTYQFNKRYRTWKPLTNLSTLTDLSMTVDQSVNNRVQICQSHLIKDNNKDKGIKTGKTGACEWPFSFCLSDNMRHFAIKGGIDPKKVDAFFDDFKDWAKDRGATSEDWEAKFRMRVNKAPEYSKQFMIIEDEWDKLRKEFCEDETTRTIQHD